MISDKLVNHRWHLLIGGRVSSEGSVWQKNAKVFSNFCSYFANFSSKFRNFWQNVSFAEILEKWNMFAFFASKRNAKKRKILQTIYSHNKCLIKWIKRLILEIRLYRDLLKARISDIFQSRLYCVLCTTGKSKNRFRDI